jgi:excisionase family DNA binding protein
MGNDSAAAFSGEPKRGVLRSHCDVLTVGQAAVRANCNPETIRRAIRRGGLEALKVGTHWRVKPDDLTEWMAAPAAQCDARPTQRRHARRRRRGTARRSDAVWNALLNP